jgi:hypothetical protein
MWLWQHKNIHKKHLLWAKLFGICLFFHLVFLFWIFIMYRDNAYTISISLNKKLDYSAPIIFLPAYAKASADKPAQSISIAEKKTAIAKPTPKTAATKTAIAPKAPIQTKAPAAITPTTATTMASTPVKPEIKPALENNKFPSTSSGCAASAQEKPEIKKTTPTVIPKVETPKSAPIKKEITHIKTPEKMIAPAEPATPAPLAKAVDTQHPIVPIIPENALVSDNYREVEALRRGAQLQKELVQKWKPPIGVSPECVCEIGFSVSKTGTLQNLKIIKSSGVVMYDISARQALYAMTMPQWTHGKQLTINFKQ